MGYNANRSSTKYIIAEGLFCSYSFKYFVTNVMVWERNDGEAWHFMAIMEVMKRERERIKAITLDPT